MGRKQQPRPAAPSRAAPPAVLAWLTAPVARRTTRGVLLYLVRDAQRPDWSPLAAARRLIDYSGTDLELLRSTRRKLEAVADHYGKATRAHALATIIVAIAELEERGPEDASPPAPARWLRR